jgi:hypothetical protein
MANPRAHERTAAGEPVNALSAEIHPDLVDRMIESYCDWRTDCAEVHAAYARFLDAPASDRAPAFAAYIAAVDREQCACEAYAAQVHLVASGCAAASARTRR